MVGGADEGAGGDVAEAFGAGSFLVFGEFIRVYVFDDGEVPGGGAEVLAEG